MSQFIKRFLNLILALNLGFWIGVVASDLRLRSQIVPYCQVARNGDWYHDKFIRVRARLIFGSDGLYIYEDCDPTEALASRVEFEEAERGLAIGYVDEVLVTGEKPGIKTADAIIEGKFNAHLSTGCWGPKYGIAARSMKLISSVSDYNPDTAGEAGLRTKH